ncbi:MAG: hypothetical protein SH847_25410 [Roseiflexaceae bacterium]|nr:hypothetical protein [Roseiflexaceae bacterium]
MALVTLLALWCASAAAMLTPGRQILLFKQIIGVLLLPLKGYLWRASDIVALAPGFGVD